MVVTVPTEQAAIGETSLSWTVAHVVDAALESLRDRTMVSAQDVTDLLLDLRTSLKQTVELEEARGRATCERPRGTWSTAAAPRRDRRDRASLPRRAPFPAHPLALTEASTQSDRRAPTPDAKRRRSSLRRRLAASLAGCVTTA